MPGAEGWRRCVEWLPEGQRDWGAEQFEGPGLDQGWGGELLDVLPGEDDGLPVEGGQVLEQVPVFTDGQLVAVVLGGVFGFGLGGAPGGGDGSAGSGMCWSIAALPPKFRRRLMVTAVIWSSNKFSLHFRRSEPSRTRP
jgi:hypothetical protein